MSTNNKLDLDLNSIYCVNDTQPKQLDDIAINFDESKTQYHGTIAIYDDVINKDACDYILNTVREKGTFTKSRVGGTDKSNISNIRTSEEINITKNKNMTQIDKLLYNIFNASIINYISTITKMWINHDYSKIIDISTDDGYILLHYSIGEKYMTHVDQDTMRNGQEKMRVVSAVLYLNEDFEGGETYFNVQDVSVCPKKGRVVIFPSSFSHIHESKPVNTGDKYSIVTWYR